MDGLFQGSPFNQPIGNWIVSNVTNMQGMFYQATAFNRDISGWNVSNVTNMSGMFNYATVFNQNISSWNVTKVTQWLYFRDGSALTTDNTPPKFR